MALEFKERSPTDGVLRVGGDVLPETIEGYRKKLYELCERKKFTLQLDLTGVEHLSSWAIGVTALATQKIRQNGGDLKICGAGENLKRILKFSRLDMIIESTSDPADVGDIGTGGAGGAGPADVGDIGTGGAGGADPAGAGA